jgi:hypothetical protein
MAVAGEVDLMILFSRVSHTFGHHNTQMGSRKITLLKGSELVSGA